MRNSIIIITLSLLAAACAPMKVSVTSELDLRQFSRAHLQKSATTYPQLHLSIIKELEKIGLEMVDGQSFSPSRNDLLVEYLSIPMRVPNNDGEVQLLPKVLELRFYSSRDHVMIAKGRFEYIGGEITTEQVVSDLFAKIDNPSSKQGASNTFIDTTEMTDTKQANQPPATSSISTKTTPPEVSAPKLKEPLQPEWLPRLQSWGFDNWGKEEIPD